MPHGVARTGTESLVERIKVQQRRDGAHRCDGMDGNRGRSPSEVAAELSLSEKTVSNYRIRIVRKLGAHTNRDLTYDAVKHGLID